MVLSVLCATVPGDNSSAAKTEWEFKQGETKGFKIDLNMNQIEDLIYNIVTAEGEPATDSDAPIKPGKFKIKFPDSPFDPDFKLIGPILKKAEINRAISSALLNMVADIDTDKNILIKSMSTDGYISAVGVTETASVTDTAIKQTVKFGAAVNLNVKVTLEGELLKLEKCDGFEDLFAVPGSEDPTEQRTVNLAFGVFLKITGDGEIVLDPVTYAVKSFVMKMDGGFEIQYKGDVDVESERFISETGDFVYSTSLVDREGRSSLKIDAGATVMGEFEEDGLNLVNGFNPGDWYSDTVLSIKQADLQLKLTSQGHAFENTICSFYKLIHSMKATLKINPQKWAAFTEFKLDKSFADFIPNVPLTIAGESELGAYGILKVTDTITPGEITIAEAESKDIVLNFTFKPGVKIPSFDGDDDLSKLFKKVFETPALKGAYTDLSSDGKKSAAAAMAGIAEAGSADPTDSPVAPKPIYSDSGQSGGGDMTLVIVAIVVIIALLGVGAFFYMKKVKAV